MFNLLVLTGTFTTGKSYIVNYLEGIDTRFVQAPAFTSRPRREVENSKYHFSIDDVLFNSLSFQVEHNGYRYGTLLPFDTPTNKETVFIASTSGTQIKDFILRKKRPEINLYVCFLMLDIDQSNVDSSLKLFNGRTVGNTNSVNDDVIESYNVVKSSDMLNEFNSVRIDKFELEYTSPLDRTYVDVDVLSDNARSFFKLY